MFFVVWPLLAVLLALFYYLFILMMMMIRLPYISTVFNYKATIWMWASGGATANWWGGMPGVTHCVSVLWNTEGHLP